MPRYQKTVSSLNDITSPEVFQPADPARTMPKWLVLAAIAAVVVIALLFTWFQNQSLSEPDEVPVAEAPATTTPVPAQPQQQPQPAANGPVVLTATAPSWIQVTDGGRTLFSGELAADQAYQVPIGDIETRTQLAFEALRAADPLADRQGAALEQTTGAVPLTALGAIIL